MMRRILVVALLLASCALAQSKPTKLPAWRIDPYTKNEPNAMGALGYKNYGPFPFGQKGPTACTSEDVEKHLAYERILWVETAHFKIGSGLLAWNVPEEPETKAKLKAELTAILKKCPTIGINPKTRVLDPWLRLHLTAYRMEKLYGEIQELLGVKDEDFPTDASKVVRGSGRYMGQGPYLGMPQKYLILIFEPLGSYTDYLKSFVGRVTKYEQRWHYKETGCLWFGVATKLPDRKLHHDTALHQCLGHNIAHNLLDGFRFYAYDLPTWITEGFAHYIERQICGDYMSYCQNEASLADMSTESKYRSTARKLVEAGKGEVFSQVFSWRDYSQVSFNDHVLIWSRIDYMITSFGKAKFAEYMSKVKGRVHADTWLTDQENLVGACRDALQDVYGLSPLSFDQKWKVWVSKTYPLEEG